MKDVKVYVTFYGNRRKEELLNEVRVIEKEELREREVEELTERQTLLLLKCDYLRTLFKFHIVF